jgi:hypothetical protein
MWMNIIEKILTFEMFVGAHLTVWTEYGGWAIGITSILQYLKRKYAIDKAKGFSFLGWWQMDGPRIMATAYALVTAVSAGLTWFINPANAAYIPTRFAFLITIGVAVHRFFISPASKKLEAKFAPYITALERLQAMEQGIVAGANAKVATAAPTQATIEKTTSPVIGSVVSPTDIQGR